MIKTGSPTTLWDHCLELEALVRSLTSPDIYMTDGKVPETIMISSTADISRIMTDIGSAWTAKFLTSNGQFVCRSTLRHLTNK
jgi:hypothetical protein